MPAEDQELLAKISQLAGHINRHKNKQDSQPNTYAGIQKSSAPSYGTSRYQYTSSQPWRGARGGYAPRGRGRGGAQPHRHRTLILNGSSTTNNQPGAATQQENVDLSGPSSSPAWVSKTDRHLQLINPAIFEKDAQARAKAIEETRKLKLKRKDDHEKNKLSRHLQHLQHATPTQARATTTSHEIVIEGIIFFVTKNGSKLIKAPGDTNAAKATPKMATVGGVRFYRSKNGNLYRSGIVKAQRYAIITRRTNNPFFSGQSNLDTSRKHAVRKIDEPCKIFSTTGSSFLSKLNIPSDTAATECVCTKGPSCRYDHDPAKVSICKEFLQKGTCPSGDSCDLSHDLTPERTPTCLWFAKGNCSNANCRYSHIRLSPSALVCRAFGIYGYCEKGSNCTERHVHECPDYSNTGVCTTKGCKLPHRLKASVIRRNTALADAGMAEDGSDLSSEEEGDPIDSDDVDSDEVDEEFFGNDDEQDEDVPMQRDFVGL